MMMEGIMKTLSLVNSALVQASPEVNIIYLYVMSPHGASLGQTIPECYAAIHGKHLLLNYLLALTAGLQRVDFVKFFHNDNYGTVFLREKRKT
jgi:hypothetical protein